MQILHTPSGVRFGIVESKQPSPAPTLFVFATRLEESLEDDSFYKAGRILSESGFLCVSLDMPCHGMDVREGEQPDRLEGWRTRLEADENIISDFTSKASAVLDYLIEAGYTDPQQVMACGTSRGGFIALHFAAADARIKAVAAFAPVTNLLRLREFCGTEQHATIDSLSLINHAEKLATRAIWLCIGNNDDRVSTDDAIAFTRRVVQDSSAPEKIVPVELHVLATEGHGIHATAHEEAAAWLLRQV